MMSTKKTHSGFKPLAIAALAVFIGLSAYFFPVPFLSRIELHTIDLRFAFRGPRPATSPLVLAVIDEKSIEQEGKWVWPRSKMTALVEKLSEAGAKVIAFDIGFLEKDETDRVILQTVDEIARHAAAVNFPADALISRLEAIKETADQDRRLASVIRNASARVVLGYFFQPFNPKTPPDPAAIEAHRKNVVSSEYKIIRQTPDATAAPVPEFQIPQSNIPVISEASGYSGFFNIDYDADGSVRRIHTAVRCGSAYYAPLALMTAAAFLEKPPAMDVDAVGIKSVRLGDMALPVDRYGNLLINFRGPSHTFPHVPVTDILNDKTDPSLFKDKIVMVGATAIGIYDIRVTPFGNVFPGLEVHANVVDNLLSRDFLQNPDWMVVMDAMSIMLSALILGWALPRTGMAAGSLLTALMFAGYIGISHVLFIRQGLVTGMIYPLIVMLILYMGITVYRFFQESRQKRFIKDAFGHYLAPSIIQELLESPDSLVLGGEERDITAFFSDLQGFTTISESLEPRVVVELLNEFLTEMTDIILRHKGTVDKFEGDAIIAFFGAPKDIGNHALAACRAGIEMQQRLAERRSEWRERYHHDLKMRIGINSGLAVIGNMGSKNRMDYTMMGDTVNTAARLEGINKIYGVYMLIGESTRRELGDAVVIREIDHVMMMGKKKPIQVYQMIGYPENLDEPTRMTLKHYADGLSAYRAKDWSRAMECFGRSLAAAPDDGPSRVLLERCRRYADAPPESGWDAVFIVQTK